MSDSPPHETVDTIFAKLTDHLDWTRAEGVRALAAFQDPAGLRALVRRLVHSAAFDCVEYQSHFGMVDAYQTECANAAHALQVIFTARDFSDDDGALIHEVVHDEHADDGCVRDLLGYLDRWTQPVLEAMATSLSARVRRRAMLACDRGKRLDPVGFLGDADARVRVAAIEALPPALDAKALEQLAHLLDDPEPNVRIAAARVLTDDRDPAVRRAAVIALARVNDAAVAHLLFGRVRAERDHEVWMALMSYEHFAAHVPHALPVFVSWLSHATSDAAADVVALAVRRFGATAAQPVARTLGTLPLAARIRAVTLLGTVADADVLPALAAELIRPENAAFAEDIAAEMAVIQQRARLLAATRHADPDVRAGAIHELWGRRGTLAWRLWAVEPLEPLIAMLDDPDRRVRITAIRELARWTVAPLARKLESERDPVVREEIIALLPSPAPRA